MQRTAAGDRTLEIPSLSRLSIDLPAGLVGLRHGALAARTSHRFRHSRWCSIGDEGRRLQRVAGIVGLGFEPLVYVNSLLNLALALNQGSYAAAHKIDSGPDWSIELSRNHNDR